MRRLSFVFALLLSPASLIAQTHTRTFARADSASLAQLRWRHIGPEGNRVTSVAGVAGDPNVYYAGAASGGLWKTTDAGIHWTPISDSLPVSSIGSVTVAPSDPNVVWIGTGEPFIRSHISVGWGVFRSTDAGRTWARAGLENTGRISRIIVHPTNPDIAYVASLGHAYGPQPERGIYRTMDGGKTWTRVLFVNDSTGASELIMDPNNPRILYAGMWQIEIHTWGRLSGGAGSGIWKSVDGGTTWRRLTGHGLPEKPVGKIGLGMSKANSSRIYALIETGDGVPAVNVADPASGRLFRSDDEGSTWQLVSFDRQLAGRTHYYNRFGVMPDNPDEAYFLSANWTKTLDGGKTVIDPPFNEVPGGDHHDIWIDPTNGNRMAVSHDGGFSVTTNRGKSWLQVQLPIAQMYHVTVDDRIPYRVYGNRQDGPSAMGPSNSLLGFQDGGITRGMWRSVGGGESGWATPDPVDTNLVWSSASGFGSVGGIVTRYDQRNGQVQQVEVWPQATIGWAADSLRYRFVWTFPLTISPNDHNTVYVGSQHVHRTTNGGRKWEEISPDLTRNDKSRQKRSGGLTPDNIGVEYSGVVFAIAESPKEKGLIWAGTNDGLLQLTRDDGRTWTNLTANIAGKPEWGTISNIEASRWDAATAYLTVDGHQVNDRGTHVYKTSDYGKTWKKIVDGVPQSPLSYAHVVREDPVRRGLLYLGTENGLYVSFDDGAHWQPMQNNLPHAPVYWIAVQERFRDLVIATYGRGFWIMDDLTPLREVARWTAAPDVELFAPRDAWRFQNVEAPFAAGYDPSTGSNPTYGASIDYWLKTGASDQPTPDSGAVAKPSPRAAVRAESLSVAAMRRDSIARDSAAKATSTLTDSVTIAILDASNTVVRTLKSPAKAGLNRVWWDLRGEQSKEAKLRTSPRYAPWLPIAIEGKAAPGLGRVAMLVAPGTYTVRLTARGKTFTQPLIVRKDPHSGGTDADLSEQTTVATAIVKDVDQTTEMVNQIETLRGQLASLRAVIAGDSTRADVRGAADSLDRKLLAAQEGLMQTRVTGRGQDQIRWPMQLAEQLNYLAGSVTGSDFAPTAQQREVQGVLHARMVQLKSVIDAIVATDVGAFNEMLRAKKMQNVISMR